MNRCLTLMLLSFEADWRSHTLRKRVNFGVDITCRQVVEDLFTVR